MHADQISCTQLCESATTEYARALKTHDDKQIDTATKAYAAAGDELVRVTAEMQNALDIYNGDKR